MDVARGKELAALCACDAGMRKSEMFQTARARLQAMSGDFDGALLTADEARAAGAAKLRTFAPALLGFCFSGAAPAARRAQSLIRDAGIALTEHEYQALLRCYAGAGDVDAFLATLSEMREELVDVTGATADVVEDFFRTAGNAAFAPGAAMHGRGERWASARIAADGAGSTPGGDLLPVALEGREWGDFLGAVRELAEQRENRKQQSFSQFVDWLQRHGPYHGEEVGWGSGGERGWWGWERG